MRIRFYLLYPVILLLFPFIPIAIGRAQQQSDTIILHTERLSVNDGLSQGLISSIIQDKDGFMWFGTKDGLNKYDGYNFTIYRYQQDEPNSLPDNYVTAIAEDKNGNLWVGTNTKGLFLFDKKHERFYPVKLYPENNALSFYTVFKLASRGSQLLVQTGQLIIYDIGNIKLNSNGIADLTSVPLLFSDRKMLPPKWKSDGLVKVEYSWFNDQSLGMIYNDSVFIYTNSDTSLYIKRKSLSYSELGLAPEGRYCIERLQNSDKYLFTGIKNVLVYNIKTKQVVSKTEFNDNYPWGRHTTEDKYGNFFITGEGPCYYFNVTDFSLKPVKGAISGSGCLDGNGILWTLTPGYGIIKSDYRKQLFHFFTQENRISDLHNNAGELLILKNSKTPCFVNAFTQKKRPVFPSAISNENLTVLDFAEDKKGNYWLLYAIQSSDKIYLIKFNPLSGKLEKREQPFRLSTFLAKFLFDLQDNLFLSISDFKHKPLLALVNSNTLSIDKVYHFPAKIQNYGHFVTDYYTDSKNKIWFATLQGLYQLDREKNLWRHWQNIAGDNNSLNNNQLLSIIPDPVQPDKYLWIGTDGGGLNRIEIATGKFIKYTEKDGLPNNVVYGLMSDKGGNIWMSTNRGLSCMSKSSPTPHDYHGISPKNSGKTNLSFLNFNSEDGLPGDEFNRTEYFKMPNGSLYFGGVEGAVIFDPEKVLEKENAPPIVFTGLSVFNKPVTNKLDSNVIQLPISYAQSIILPHYKNMFSISFAALEYRASSKKQYRYYLENYDDTWIEAGSKNEATYTNLPPGTYTFHVKAKGSMSDWTVNDASIEVIILPAWYQTWWFRLAVLLAVAAAVYGLYMYRLRKALQLQKIRNRIASDLHDEIGSTLSSISISSSIIQNKMKGTNGDVGGLLNQISTNTDSMMEAMSDIVWTINTKNDRFTNIINRMRAFAIEILDPKNCMVHFNARNIPEDLKFDMVQRKNLYLIFKEAINNAAKYAECNNVWIDISLNGHKKLVMKIKDDGKGFAPHNGNVANGFGGNGLTNMHKRAGELSGKLKIDAAIGNGVEVSLEFVV